MPSIAVVTPDGSSKSVPLTGDRLTVGRSSANHLCYPEDNGLSRQHLAFERDGEVWSVADSGSKNGTLVNGERLIGKRPLRPGDRIAAGHLTLVFDAPVARAFSDTVVFIEGREAAPARAATTVATNLASLVTDAPTASRAAVTVDRIGALIKAGRELATHRPLDELFPLILSLSLESVNAERGVLLTLEGEELVVRAARGQSFRISGGVRDRVLKEKTSVLVNDVFSDENFRAMQSLVQQQVRMFMAAPLQTNDRVIGLIYVDNPQILREFTVDDLNLLTVMANVAAIRIEHARLAEVEQAEKILAKDLEQAAIIQRQLLPAGAPSIAGLEIAGYNLPCRTVGGDYYDYLPYPDGRIGVALGDVSGKAMPAALLMTSLHARVHVLAEEPVNDVAAFMTRLNRGTTAHSPTNRFISFFFSVINPQTGQVQYCNAGHNPPLLVRTDGTVERLETGGMLLGLFAGARFEEGQVVMNPGDTLVIYSDGVSEANNPAGEEFDEERLVQLAIANRDGSAEQLIQAVNQELVKWTAGAPYADDATIVVARRLAPSWPVL